jgi:hypothetical protein
MAGMNRMDPSTRFVVIFLGTLVVGGLMVYLFLEGKVEALALVIGIIGAAVIYKYVDNLIKDE